MLCESQGFCAVLGPLSMPRAIKVVLVIAALTAAACFFIGRWKGCSCTAASFVGVVLAAALSPLLLFRPLPPAPPTPDRNAVFIEAGASRALADVSPALANGSCTSFLGTTDLFVFCGQHLGASSFRPSCAETILRCDRERTHLAQAEARRKAISARGAARCTPFQREDGRPMCLPSFFLLGIQKAGTTWLYQLLERHPQVVPMRKEPWFFGNGGRVRAEYDKAHNLIKYLRLFPSAAELVFDDRIVGDGSVSTLRSPPSALHALVPNARLLVILREPSSRSSSVFRYYCSKQFEPDGSRAIADVRARKQAVNVACSSTVFADGALQDARRELSTFGRCMDTEMAPSRRQVESSKQLPRRGQQQHVQAAPRDRVQASAARMVKLRRLAELDHYVKADVKAEVKADAKGEVKAEAALLTRALRSPLRTVTRVRNCYRHLTATTTSLGRSLTAFHEGLYWIPITRWWSAYPTSSLLILDYARLADARGARKMAAAIASHLGLSRPYSVDAGTMAQKPTYVTHLRGNASDTPTLELLRALYAPHNEILLQMLTSTPGAYAEGFESGETFRWAMPRRAE